MSLPRILLSPSSACFCLPQICSFSGCCVFLCLVFFGRGWGRFSALGTFTVFSSHCPHQIFLPSSLPPSPDALTVNVEPGSMDAATLVPSFLLENVSPVDRTGKHRNSLSEDRLLASARFSSLSREGKKPEPVGQMKDFPVICCMSL